MDSDEVNSISDTTESIQVATILENVYNDLVTEIELPDEYLPFQLDTTGVDTPVTMTIPNDIVNMEWVKYNKVSTTETVQNFEEIKYLPNKEFLEYVSAFNESDDNVATYTLTYGTMHFDLMYKTDVNPTYYTTFDQRTIVFDSLDTAVETTLQSSKTFCYGKKDYVFVQDDTFVPFTEKKYESLLFNTAKATAFAELKQMTNMKAEKTERRARIKTQSSKYAVPHGQSAYDKIQGYGRRR